MADSRIRLEREEVGLHRFMVTLDQCATWRFGVCPAAARPTVEALVVENYGHLEFRLRMKPSDVDFNPAIWCARVQTSDFTT